MSKSEVELTETEAAKFKANNEAMKNLQNRMQQLQRQMQQLQEGLKEHNMAQKALASQVLERADIDKPLDEVPLEDWDFSQVDFLNYAGTVLIPEGNGKEPETAQPQSQEEG